MTYLSKGYAGQAYRAYLFMAVHALHRHVQTRWKERSFVTLEIPTMESFSCFRCHATPKKVGQVNSEEREKLVATILLKLLLFLLELN